MLLSSPDRDGSDQDLHVHGGFGLVRSTSRWDYAPVRSDAWRHRSMHRGLRFLFVLLVSWESPLVFVYAKPLEVFFAAFRWKYVDVGDFGMNDLKTLSRLGLGVLSDLVIRPLPCQRSHGSCPGSLPRVVCAVLSFVMPFIITFLCRSTPLYISAPEGFNRGFASTKRQKMLGGVHQ
ncbi:hypothetical protein DEO72_LG4g1985 [Vigna unguiculata]|uniref:Uncharacterized protein n=1 Tax=Vigna unguiculata TaxID=3917 RepID=A0A4D6LRC8_VIGUN|nr:hypothetical protein DEO72_LG4g1985 [Vigna unguiculata]